MLILLKIFPRCNVQRDKLGKKLRRQNFSLPGGVESVAPGFVVEMLSHSDPDRQIPVILIILESYSSLKSTLSLHHRTRILTCMPVESAFYKLN